MAKKKTQSKRRAYPQDLKEEAVQMLLDGHSASSVVANLGLSSANVLYRWKAKMLRRPSPEQREDQALSSAKTKP